MSGPLDADFLAKHGKKKLNIGVGIDGSQMSDKALAAAACMFDGKRGDQLCLLHIADSQKQYLPRHLQPAHLKNAYEAKAFELKMRNSKWFQKEKEGLSTCEALTQLANDNAVDLLVAGSFGRKGEKLDMLGSVADYSLRQVHSSVCVVRPGATPNPTAGQCYMIAIDSSHASAHAFCVLVHQLLRPVDRVLAVHVSYGNNAEEAAATCKRYKEMMDAHKVHGEAVIHNMSRADTVADALLHLTKLKQVDVLVLGISGYQRAKLGSVSDEITHKADCTTLVIKDGYEANTASVNSAGARTLASMIQPRSKMPGALERSSMEAPSGGLSRKSVDMPRGSAGDMRKSGCLARSSLQPI